MQQHWHASPILNESLHRLDVLKKSRIALPLAASQIPLGFILFLDSSYHLIFPEGIFWILIFFGALLLANGLHAAVLYLFPLMGLEPITLNARQMKLLGVNQKSPGFKLSKAQDTTPKASQPPPLEGSFIATSSPRRSESGSPGTPTNISGLWNTPSANGSLNSSSWIFHQQGLDTPPQHQHQQQQQQQQSQQNLPADFKRSHFNSSVGSLTDEKSLNDYLREFEAWEKSNNTSSFLSSNGEGGGGGLNSNNSSNSFWKTSSNTTPNSSAMMLQDYSPILKKYSYQLSTPILGSTTTDSDGKEKDGDKSGGHHQQRSLLTLLRGGKDLSARLGMNPLDIVDWMQNLRMWISQTILVRLVEEIDATNQKLKNLGMSDSRIGEVGLEKLKKISQFMQLQSVTAIIPFLEITTNQEYLVQRIRDLSRGGAMSEYRWNGGGRFKGVEWTDKLITDSEIVMHLVACYFDSRLPPNFDVTDGRAFSSLYYFRAPEKPDPKKHRVPVAIVQSALKPPYFYLQTGQEIQEVSPGPNNLFHVLLLFLHHIKTKDNGMVGRINFGISGVNILWVID